MLNQFATAPNIAKGAPKMELRLIIGAALALILGGCVSSSKALRNTNGEVITCKASGYGWLGAPVALISQNDCLKKYRQQGYYALDEDPNTPKLAVSALRYNSSIKLTLSDDWASQQITSTQASSGIKLYGLNRTIDAGVMLSTVKRDAISDFEAYARSRRRAAQSVGKDNLASELKISETNGLNIAQYGAVFTIENIRYHYEYKIIRGASEIAIVTVWSTDGNFDSIKPELDRLVNSVEGV